MVSQTLLQSSIWLYNKVALTNTTGWVNVTTEYWATQTKHDSETYNVMDRQMMTTPSPQDHKYTSSKPFGTGSNKVFWESQPTIGLKLSLNIKLRCVLTFSPLMLGTHCLILGCLRWKTTYPGDFCGQKLACHDKLASFP